MLKPERILFIKSDGFSKNKQQRTDWYTGFSGYIVNGFPKEIHINKFLSGLTHVLVCENPLNFYLFSRARQLGIKTYCQSNYEFCDNLSNPDLPEPDYFLMPSYWKVEEMKKKFGDNRVIYLPPPINPQEFKEVREINLQRKDELKILHVVGTLAIHDRNGTLDLLKALQFTKAQFSLTIYSQHQLPAEYMIGDSRVKYIMSDMPESNGLYKDYDIVIMPRRFGGLSLIMNEALLSGLPVFMPDISPNNKILPKEWLFNAYKTTDFMARVPIDVYSSYVDEIAKKITVLASMNLEKMKIDAFELGYNNFSETVLKSKYEAVFNL